MAYYREDPESLPVVDFPPCQHLLSKAMFVTGEVDPGQEEEIQHGEHCWCGMTQGALGPDGQLADRRECSPQRSCYRARW